MESHYEYYYNFSYVYANGKHKAVIPACV